MEGGCCCGQVRYRIERAPLAVHCCHCTMCQRETGSVLALLSIIEATNMTLLAPAPPTASSHLGAPDTFPPVKPVPAPRTAEEQQQQQQPALVRAQIPQESGFAQTAVHCAVCLTAVWKEYVFGPAVRFVLCGTLDRAWLVQPDVVLFARSRRGFVGAPEGVPVFEEYYDRNEVWRPESLERWAEVLPEIEKHRASLKKSE